MRLVVVLGVVKLSSNGKTVLFVDDCGVTYFTSSSYLRKVLDGLTDRKGFVLLKRFATPIAKGKFMESPVWDPNGLGDLGEGSLSSHKKKVSEALSLRADVMLE